MRVRTVRGWKDAKEIGVTYCHEHLQVDLSGHKKDPDTNFNDVTAVTEEFATLGALGVKAVIDVTTRGMGRNVEAMLRISEETGLDVIASTGFYKEPFLPDYFFAMSEQQLTQLLVADIDEGIEGTGICAHVIGEIGTGLEEITPAQHKLFRVAAAAHYETGRPIYTHTTLGTMALGQIELLKERGVDLTRVAMGHMDLKCDRDYHLRVAAQGCYVCFDTVGKLNYETDDNRILHLRQLIAEGHLGQILLSQDITRKSHLVAYGGIGYSYLLSKFVPRLKECGFSEAEIDAMLVANPRRFLTNCS